MADVQNPPVPVKPGTHTPPIPEARRAPAGHIWQCRACGKVAEDRYGFIGLASPGWDESCMLNAVTVPGVLSAKGEG